jgi:hypothetical protein
VSYGILSILHVLPYLMFLQKTQQMRIVIHFLPNWKLRHREVK